MAGIKITDLPALSVADSADYLCIVDVSDTSASAAGTTKKIEVANYGIGGQYTPSYTASTGFTVPVFNAVYSIIGKVMNLGVYIQNCIIDFDVDTLATIDIELPSGYTGGFAGGAVSIKFNSAPFSTITPVYSLANYAGSGKVRISLQNYGGETNSYDISATFTIMLQ
jgi:hypothetical protein